MKKVFIFIIVCFAQWCFGQREANIWQFGAGAGLDFNSCEPIAVASSLVSTEGCTSIADTSGELQFYTEGTTIWNRNHVQMSNGNGLLGHRSATQSSMIIKRPGSLNEYFVFAIDEIGKSNGLTYSIVDMNGDNGLGEVTLKNIPLVAPIVEKIHATRHVNGTDVWVSVHGFGNNNFYSFLVSSTGINVNPIVSTVGPVISGDDVATIGAMKFSPNGRKLAMCNYEHGVDLFDFNPSNGQFSNAKEITAKPYSYGIEFSKSNNIIYVSTSYLDLDNKLLQYNLNAADIQNSEIELLNLSNSQIIGALQLGPDSKIYVSISNRQSLGVIEQPNNIGLSCNFVEDAIDLVGGEARRGLPLFLAPIFHNEMIVEDTCFGDTTSFMLSENIETIEWDFGDPASGVNNKATDNEPEHVFSQPGIYTVTTSVLAGCGTEQYITEQVEIFDIQTSPSVQLMQCDDNLDGYTSFNLNKVKTKLSSNYNISTVTFYKTEDEAKRRINNIAQPISYKNVIANSDSVWLSVGNNGGCYDVIEVNLIVSSSQVFDSFQPIEYNRCDDDRNDGVAVFDISQAESIVEGLFTGQVVTIMYYRNLEDAMAETNSITNLETYENIGYPYKQDIYVRVNDTINNDCLGIANLLTLIVKKTPNFELPNTVEFCPIDIPTFTIAIENPDDNYTYEWTDFNGNVISTNSDILVSEGGMYTVVATSSNGCKSPQKKVEVLEFNKIELNLNMITVNDGLNNNTIVIDETKIGSVSYEYALDNEFGVYQEAPFFNNVSAGVHTIYAREKNICKPGVLEVSIIGFSKFFTPNNDGQNDTWNLKGLGQTYASSSKVSIFDKYGKFIKQLNPWGVGWDGTFNGQNVMQSDYWFVAELINQEGGIRFLRGHFSLIR